MMHITFRILDRDFQRAEKAESVLRRCMKAHRIIGDAFQVHELLEFSRIGVTALPALELNGFVLHQGKTLNAELLNDVCFRLVRAQQHMALKKNSSEKNDV
ncbi:MAG: hypothetical protein HQ517_02020 [SAR324 cluster bacterium]|nr:hypothetical protein [SAR324 cluster bacterium]